MERIDFSEWDSRKNNFAAYGHVQSRLIYGEHASQIPFIAVMIPTYRRADLLEQALLSVLRQEDYTDYEIIVVDNDAGIDRQTDELMGRFCAEYAHICYYRNDQNLGMYGNWNRCMELCRSEWFCMLHDDDLLKEEYLKTVAKYIGEYPDTAVLSVYRENLDQRNRASAFYSRYGKNKITSAMIALLVRLRRGRPIPISLADCVDFFNPLLLCAVFSKKRCIEAGGYDEQYFPISDFFFVCKISYYEKVLLVPQCLWYYRYSENGTLKLKVQTDALYQTRYLLEELCTRMGYRPRKTRRKYSEAVLYMWSGNSKLSSELDFEETVISNCGLSRLYRSRLVRSFVFFKRHLLRIRLFLKKNRCAAG